MVTLLLLLAAQAEPVPLVVMDLERGEGASLDDARTLVDLVTQEVAEHAGLRAISGADMRNLAALEGERQALGCEENTECLAEIANALGARYVLFGRLSTLGGEVVLQLNLMDAEQAISLGRELLQRPSAALVGREVPAAVRRLLVPLTGSPGPDLGALGLSVGGGLALAGLVTSSVAFLIFADHEAFDAPTRQGAQATMFGSAALATVGVVVGSAGLASMMLAD